MMYKLIYFISICVFALIFTFCGNFSELNTTIVRVNLSEDFPIQADTGATPAEFSVSKKFNPNTNKDYFAKINATTQLEIEKIAYRVTNITPGSSDSLVLASFEFLNPETGLYEVLASDQDRKLIVNQTVALTINPDVRARLANRISSKNPDFEIRIKGMMKNRPVSLIIAPDIQLSLKVKI